MRARWLSTLGPLSSSLSVHGLVAGRCARILLDAGQLAASEVADHLAAALSPGESPARAAAWVEGLVAGSGLLLVHDPTLLAVIDGWVAGVPEAAFDDVVPLLRRSFAGFEARERELIASAADRLDGGGVASVASGQSAASGGLGDIDLARAERVVPLLRLLLGAESSEPPA
jgi:hypothetical protein